jgi:hypothetical protein
VTHCSLCAQTNERKEVRMHIELAIHTHIYLFYYTWKIQWTVELQMNNGALCRRSLVFTSVRMAG